MALGLHHTYTKKIAKIPNASVIDSTPSKHAMFNKLAYPVGIITVFFNVPQVFQIWSTGNAAGVSSISWVGYTLASLFWFTYAIYHKEKVLIVTFGGTLIMQIAITIGSLIY